jgi:outer membrane protein assembly factor BamB
LKINGLLSKFTPSSKEGGTIMYPRIIRAAVPGPLIVLLLLLLLLLLAMAACGSAATPCHPSGTTTGTWPQANDDYANTRDAAASLLSSHNVNQLCVVWTFQVSGISASDALTTNPIGTQLWSRQIPQPTIQGIDQQLTAYQGTLYLSTVPVISSSRLYPAGSMGIIYALDEQTGSIKWSFNTVKDGDLWGNPQVNSGGGAWYPPAIDTSTGTTYWGTGNAAPFPGTQQYPNGSSRPGPNLYTDSELALTSSGQLRWYQQIKPHGLFDDDFETSPILTTARVHGAQQQVVIGSGKLGYVVAFDAHTGQQLWKTAVGQHQNDETQTIPAGQTITVLPGALGGALTPLALADGVVYVPIVNAATQFSSTHTVNQVLSKGTGELDALDVNTGKILWTSPLKEPDFGGATVSGDLVFTSTFTGQVLAFNRSSGHQVWSWQTPTHTNGLLTVVGDTILVPAALGTTPMLIALRVGTTGAD